VLVQFKTPEEADAYIVAATGLAAAKEVINAKQKHLDRANKCKEQEQSKKKGKPQKETTKVPTLKDTKQFSSLSSKPATYAKDMTDHASHRSSPTSSLKRTDSSSLKRTDSVPIPPLKRTDSFPIDPLANTINVENVKVQNAKKESSSSSLQKAASEDLGSGSLFKGIAVLVVVVGCGLMCVDRFKSWLPEINKMGHSYRPSHHYANNVREMKRYFPKQDRFLWLAIENIGRKHLERVEKQNKDDLRPLAFLIASHDRDHSTSSCFVNLLGKAFTIAPYETIDCRELSKQYPDAMEAKLILDTKVLTALKDKQKFIVILNVDALQFDSAQLFMSYTDAYSDVAKFPQSTMLLTMTVPKAEQDIQLWKNKIHRIEAHFKQIYSQSDINDVAPLWSRMGDGAVMLNQEPDIESVRICRS